MNRFASSPAYLNGLPSTSQTTVYVTGDNGTNQVGVPHRYEVLTTGQYSGTTAITLNGKTDTHANACVADHQFKIMFSRTPSASVGISSNGTLPFTTNGNGEGAFAYAAAANSASLAGFTNWRLPTDAELVAMRNMEAPTGSPDASEFPAITGNYWSSTTRPDTTANAMVILISAGLPTSVVKTTESAYRVWLVRSV